jgi:RNA polymerase sigma-70 factor (ECF subfamily)
MRFTRTNNETVSDTTEDKTLVRLVSEGREDALNVLMGRYKHKLFAFISRYVKDEDAAYDILQETFIRLHFKAETYSPAYTFSTWLYQIAINLCRDWGRKQKVRQFLSLDTGIGNEDGNATYHDIIADPGNNIEDLADTRQQLKIIAQEIQKLPHKLKTALILFAVEGNSQEVCAELLNVTAKTVETRVYRARKILAEKLAKNF